MRYIDRPSVSRSSRSSSAAGSSTVGLSIIANSDTEGDAYRTDRIGRHAAAVDVDEVGEQRPPALDVETGVESVDLPGRAPAGGAWREVADLGTSPLVVTSRGPGCLVGERRPFEADDVVVAEPCPLHQSASDGGTAALATS